MLCDQLLSSWTKESGLTEWKNIYIEQILSSLTKESGLTEWKNIYIEQILWRTVWILALGDQVPKKEGRKLNLRKSSKVP